MTRSQVCMGLAVKAEGRMIFRVAGFTKIQSLFTDTRTSPA